MPNRLIKDSIYESDKISKLTDFQFRVWVILITYVDDYGRGDARPAIIKGRCFPLRREVTEEEIGMALYDLSTTGCIHLYAVDGKPYFCFPNWAKHQNIRNKKSKYPDPTEADADSSQQIANSCNQLYADDCKSPRNPIQSNTNTESNTESKEEEEDARAREDNQEWVRFIRDYGDNIGLFPTGTVAREDMWMFFDEFGYEALNEIIILTARKYPDNPKAYFDRLCRSMLGKKIRTREQVKAAIKDYERQKGGRNGANRGNDSESPRRVFGGETIL